jgi:hypothetical protein
MLVSLLAQKKQNVESFNTQLIKMLAVICTILCTAPLNIGKLSRCIFISTENVKSC